MKPTLVNAADINTLEEYAAHLLSAVYSLKTLELFEISAFKKGLFDNDELETSKTLLWEIARLIAIYQTQMHHVLDRTNLKENDIVNIFRKILPEIKIPRNNKKSNKVKENKEI